MSINALSTRIAGLFTTLLLLSAQALVSQATVLPPGGAIALSGTTVAAQPELAGLALVDDLIPYQIFGGGGNPLLYEGILQARIVRSTLSDNLIFNYRLRDPTAGLNGIMITLEASDFASWTTDVEYRTDGVGTKAPTRATRSNDGSDVSFIFGNSLFSNEDSYFMHILTNAKAYTTGQTILTLTDGSSVVLSTYQPAVPEPGSAVLLAIGAAGLLLLNSRRKLRNNGNNRVAAHCLLSRERRWEMRHYANLLACIGGAVLMSGFDSTASAAVKQLFWTAGTTADGLDDAVGRANLDGTNAMTIVNLDGNVLPFQIAVDEVNFDIYWAEFHGIHLKRANHDGSNVQTLITHPLNNIAGVALDRVAGHFYYSGFGDTIHRADLDGNNIQLISEPDRPRYLELDLINDKIYWSNNNVGGEAVWRSDLDGSNPQIIIPENFTRFALGLALDIAGNALYIADSDAERILKSELDGSNVQVLVPGVRGPHGLALDLDNGWLYWAATDIGEIQRSRLDGSDVQTVVSGLINPRGVAIGLVPEPTAAAIALLTHSGLLLVHRSRR